VRGTSRPIAPTALRVLVHLIENRERVVGKRELLATFWPGVAVTENSLAQAIRQIRHALVSGGVDAAPIVSVYRQGYRFVGELHARPPERRIGFAARPAIAVLATRRGPARDVPDYLVEGIADELAGRLASFRWFPIVSSRGARSGAAERSDERAAARALGARYAVCARVSRLRAELRVDVRLLDVDSGSVLARESRDGSLSEVLARQEPIAAAVIAALHPALLRSEIDRAVRAPPAQADAWDHFMRGLWQLWRYTRDDNAAARASFAEATRVDPSFASPHSFSALSHLNDANAGWTDSPAYSVGQALSAAEESVRLDDRDPWGQAMLGGIWAVVGRRVDAVAALERAIERNPSFALAHWALGRGFSIWGRAGQAVELFVAALRLSPHDPFAAHFHEGLGFAHYFLRDFAAAAQAAQRSLALRSDWGRTHLLLAASLAKLDRAGEAAAALDDLRRIAPGITLETLRASYAYANAEPGLFEALQDGLVQAGWTNHSNSSSRT
jgi:TolB-like protein